MALIRLANKTRVLAGNLIERPDTKNRLPNSKCVPTVI
jgi:hypothetical protein